MTKKYNERTSSFIDLLKRSISAYGNHEKLFKLPDLKDNYEKNESKAEWTLLHHDTTLFAFTIPEDEM